MSNEKAHTNTRLCCRRGALAVVALQAVVVDQLTLDRIGLLLGWISRRRRGSGLPSLTSLAVQNKTERQSRHRPPKGDK